MSISTLLIAAVAVLPHAFAAPAAATEPTLSAETDSNRTAKLAARDDTIHVYTIKVFVNDTTRCAENDKQFTFVSDIQPNIWKDLNKDMGVQSVWAWTVDPIFNDIAGKCLMWGDNQNHSYGGISPVAKVGQCRNVPSYEGNAYKMSSVMITDCNPPK